MVTVENLAYVEMAGTPRERGRIHGEALRHLIVSGMERWREGIERTTSTQFASYLTAFLDSSDFLPAIERWAPDLLEEVRGIAEGADLDFDGVYAYQLMDEEWFFRSEYVRSNRGQPEHCSTIAVFGEGAPPILAQNMDLPKTYDGTQALLRIVDDESGVESLVFTPAGLIGTTGLNSRAVGVCVNSIPQLGFAHHGLPVAFVVRRTLACQTWTDAVQFVRDVPHASAQNIAIGGPEMVVDFECAPDRVARFMPEGTRICHTNHPLAGDEQQGSDDEVLGLAFGKGANGAASDRGSTPGAVPPSDTVSRFAFLDRALADNSRSVDVERVKALLSTFSDVAISVPRSGVGNGMTLGSLVMELSLPPVLHLAPGPPAETPYRRWSF